MTANLGDLLDALGHHDGERISICHQTPGGTFTADIVDLPNATHEVARWADTADVWWGVNPTAATTGRGDLPHVTRWAAAYADLDVKPAGLPTLEAAHAVIDDLSAILGTRPTVVVHSGGGLQPYWGIDPDDTAAHLDNDQRRTAAVARMRRFGRLVAAVAERHGGHVDPVFDLPRVLRVPGTYNRKAQYGQPRPVTADLHDGAPLTAEQLDDVLLEYGITPLPEDTEDFGEVLSPPAEWKPAATTCTYTTKMIDGWATDPVAGSRHNWLVGQAVRLAAAARNGCLTEADYQRGANALNARMTALVATGPDARALSPGELSTAHSWGRARVSAMTDERVAAELNDHKHQAPVDAPSRPAPPLNDWHPTGNTTAGGTEGSLATVVDLDERRRAPHPTPGAEQTLDYSDDGNALLLVERFGDAIRYCADRGLWLAWDGARWTWCDRTGGIIREYAKRIARALPADSTAAYNHKKRSLSASGTSAMLSQASTDARVTIDSGDLDAHPLLLNTPDGVVDLRTGQLHPHDPTQLHTRMTAVTPNPDQPTPRWDAFLADTFAGHEELIPFVQALIGYSTTGVVTHHVLPFALGPGGNGKSVFLDVARGILGDYAGTAPGKFLMVGQQQHETEVARLSGMRLVICSEINQDDRFDEAKVKLLTGGDALTARFMRADHFTFIPTHKLWLMGNHQPRVSGGGESFWRRLRMLNFSNTIADEKKVDGLDKILATEEGAGILAWIIAGAQRVIEGGLTTPSSVLEATGIYAREEDSLSRFIADRCHLGGGDYVRVDTRELRGAYEQWCRDEGDTALSATAFGRELNTKHNIRQVRSHGRRFYVGVTVLADENESVATAWNDR